MPGKHCNGQEKTQIIAWRQENVTIKTICERSGRAKSTIMKVLASSSGLKPNVIPVHKFKDGSPKKTSNAIDGLLERELKKRGN